jgi:antirestriction protein ArdC
MPQRPRLISQDQLRARYYPATDIVNMPRAKAFKTPESYYSTLFHELGHSTGHSSRLDRPFGLSFGDDTYSKEELVAELTAGFLCATAGIEKEILDNTAAYIASWLSVLKKDKRMIIYAAAQAQKAADFMLGKAVTQELEEAA